MDDELEDHAGKPAADRHSIGEGVAPDPSDHADDRVVQPGEDPPDEDALAPNAPR